MKEILESLEIVDGKLTKEQIKTILAENSKLATKVGDEMVAEKEKEMEVLKTNITDLNAKIKEAPTTKELEELKTKVTDYELAEADRVKNQEANEIEKGIKTRFENILGDKKFINEYTQDSFYNKFKEELAKDESKGKGDKDIFDYLSKDTNNVFANENPKVVKTPGVADIPSANVTKEAFSKMSYSQRIQLKQENEALFNELNSK